MKKILIVLPFILATMLSACSKDSKTSSNQDSSNIIEDSTVETDNTQDIPEESKKEDTSLDTTDKNTAQDTSEEDKATTENPTSDKALESKEDKSATGLSDDTKANGDISDIAKSPSFVPVDKIPAELLTIRKDNAGTIEHISYQTKDYFGDKSEITKYAYVYLPYNYDETNQYNVLYLMHGIGGNEKEWGMYNDISKVKVMMDNLIYNESIEPFIIVAPNGRSSKDFANTSSDYNSFYLFGQELRNDLIPYIDNTYATFAEYDEASYDLTAARDHRAMAGLSMGGMQTINIGICESLDLLSYFGAFSAAPTSYTASQIATTLKDYPDYDIHYFYNICGLQDGIAINSASSAVNSLTTLTDKLTENVNFTWQEVNGGHDFNIWYLGFYNFAQVVFK